MQDKTKTHLLAAFFLTGIVALIVVAKILIAIGAYADWKCAFAHCVRVTEKTP